MGLVGLMAWPGSSGAGDRGLGIRGPGEIGTLSLYIYLRARAVGPGYLFGDHSSLAELAFWALKRGLNGDLKHPLCGINNGLINGLNM